MFNLEIIKDIVCPIGKKELKYEGNFLVCTNCGLKFPIVYNIPVMIVEEAILPVDVSSINDLSCKKR